MDYESIRHEIEHSATLKLLRSRNAALVVSFLYQQFKTTQRVAIAQLDLETKLSDYLEHLQDIDPNRYPRSPREYLNEWCDDLLLRKSFGDGDDPIFTLTPAVEKAIGWLEDLQQREEFVGTESRFLQIFSLLKEIRDRSTTDIEARITQLAQDRDRIQQEIDLIRQTGTVERYNQTQLQERFLLANQVTRQLIADFKAVEQNFRGLTRTVQEAQLQQDARRGAVVSRVLDADQELKESDQGRSFYAFWNFLMSTQKREELKSLIQNVYTLPELRILTQEYGLLRRIERSLIDAGQYIVQSNHRLAEKLRQMLDERNRMENRRVAELITDVQRLALQVAAADQLPTVRDFWLLEGDPAVNLVMARPLHPLEESEPPTFSLDFSDLPDVTLDEELAELYEQFYVDEEVLAQRIARSLEHTPKVALTELIQLYPVTQGLPEIVAYVAIASQSDRHAVNTSTIDSIMVNSLESTQPLRLSLPQVIFHR
jgi:hypothetical protein